MCNNSKKQEQLIFKAGQALCFFFEAIFIRVMVFYRQVATVFFSLSLFWTLIVVLHHDQSFLNAIFLLLPDIENI